MTQLTLGDSSPKEDTIEHPNEEQHMCAAEGVAAVAAVLDLYCMVCGGVRVLGGVLRGGVGEVSYCSCHGANKRRLDREGEGVEEEGVVLILRPRRR